MTSSPAPAPPLSEAPRMAELTPSVRTGGERRRTWLLLAGLVIIFIAGCFLAPLLTWISPGTFGAQPPARLLRRSLQIAAALLLAPYLALQWRRLGWQWRGCDSALQLAIGFSSGVGTIAFVMAVEWALGERSWAGLPGFGAAGQALLSGALVAAVEETLFRGIFLKEMLFGLLSLTSCRLVNRSLGGASKSLGTIAVLLSACFFASLHFLYAPPQAGEVTLLTGWQTLFLGFARIGASPVHLQLWISLFLAGVVIGSIFLREGRLWGCAGLHAGWVATIKALSTSLPVKVPHDLGVSPPFNVEVLLNWPGIVLLVIGAAILITKVPSGMKMAS